VRFVKSSDQSLLVYFDPPQADPSQAAAPQSNALRQANENVRRLLHLLELQPVPGVRNLHPAYCSLLVKFDPRQLRHEELEEVLRHSLHGLEKVHLPESRLVEIPVCYGNEFGPDLQSVASLHGMSPEQVVSLHCSTTYLVYFLGFVPGFAYLGELPKALVTPRHATPRRKVPAGTVGIAGNQTGVYPCETPGGWQLLGRTPLALVRPEQKNLSLLAIGDQVRFKPISREEFTAMERA
jgi:inhibitor of KinA